MEAQKAIEKMNIKELDQIINYKNNEEDQNWKNLNIYSYQYNKKKI